MDIEKTLHPKTGELQIKEGICEAKIFDVELDLLSCEFSNDETVKIDTKEFSYIQLTTDNLYKLIELIDKANEYYTVSG